MNITIIGAGLACFNLVKSLRKRKFDGEIIVLAQCNASQYYKPKLSTGFSDAILPFEQITEQQSSWAEKYNVRVFPNVTVTEIINENKCLRSTIGKHYYDKLVLAYGAKPRALKKEMENKVALHDINSLESYNSFFEQTVESKIDPVIVGAGLVGCELSSDLANSGYAPTVISASSYPFGTTFPKPFSEFIKRKLMSAGVTFIDDEKVVDVQLKGADIELKLSSGSTKTTSLAVNCAGLAVDIQLAATAGIDIDQGVLTDDYLRTNIENIFAIGDCAQICGKLHQYIAPIHITSKALASTLLGEMKKVDLTFYPIEVKIQQSPTRFMLKHQPDKWQTENTEDGMIARAYLEEKMCGFAVTGDAIEHMNDLVMEMSTHD